MFASIRTKIQLACVTIVVCALVLAGGLNYLVAQAHNEQAIQSNLQSVANGHATGIDDWIASKLQLIVALQDAALSDDPVPMFQTVAKAGGLIKVYVGYPDKSYKFSNPEGIPPTYDPTARPWYKQAVEAGKPVVTPPYVSASTGQLVVTFAVPILEGGSLKGVIGGDVAMDSVIANVKAIHPTPASFGFLVNAAGKIVAHPNDKLTLKPATDLSAGLNEATLASLAQAEAGGSVGGWRIQTALPPGRKGHRLGPGGGAGQVRRHGRHAFAGDDVDWRACGCCDCCCVDRRCDDFACVPPPVDDPRCDGRHRLGQR